MSGNCKGYTKSADKEKKIDVVKRFLIQSMGEIAENLADNGTIEIANPEREFTFVYKDKKYKIVLSCPRNQRGQFFFENFYLTFQTLADECQRALFCQQATSPKFSNKICASCTIKIFPKTLDIWLPLCYNSYRK